jgi:hypothetical protein
MGMNMFAHLFGGGVKPQAAPPGNKGAKGAKPKRGAQAEAETTEEEAADDKEEAAEDDETDGEDGDEAEGEDGDEEATAQAIATAVRQAVANERKRCAAIFAAPAAAGNVPQACVLAFNTNLSATQAISVLSSGNASPPAKGSSLSSAMRSLNVPPLGGGGGDDGADDAVKMLSAAVTRTIKDMRGNAK